MQIQTQPMAWHDLQTCLRRAPVPLLAACKKFGNSLIVAGGYIRACASNEIVNDADCFAPSKDTAREIALYLASCNGEKFPVHETPNAFTILSYRIPIQIIHRWVFNDITTCIESFDFTISRAGFWWKPSPAVPFTNPDQTVTMVEQGGDWCGVVDSHFYQDLAAKRLIYCAPVRNEDAGGSLLRVLKYYQRGYRIPLDSYAAVISRLMMGVRTSYIEAHDEANWQVPVELKLTGEITRLLREVDPEIDPKHIAHLPSETP